MVIETKDPTNPEIVSFLNKKGYETIKEKLKTSRLNIILKFIISFLGSLGFVIILLAFLVFVVSFQLIISRSSDKIRRLKWLGFHYREISKPYIIKLAYIILLLTGLTVGGLMIIKNLFLNYTSEWGLFLSEGIHPGVFLIGATVILLLFLVNTSAIFQQTKNIH